MLRIANKLSFMRLILSDHSKWVACSLAVLVSALAIWVSEIYWSYAGTSKSHTMFPMAAVFISAVVGGILPGLLSVMLTTLGLTYFLTPTNAIYVESSSDRIWLAVYFVLSLGAVWLGSALKSALQHGRQSEERLEREVENRTRQLTSKNEELRALIAEIEESRVFLDSLIDNIPLQIYVKSADDLKIIKINKAAREAAENKNVEPLGKTVFEILPQETALKATKTDRQALSERNLIEYEEEIHNSFFGDKVFSIKKAPLFDRAGKMAYVLTIVEDIGQKKRLEEEKLKLAYEKAARAEAERKKWELEEAVRARDTFLSICSHELKTPLTSLKMQAGVIRMLFEKGDVEALQAPKVRELVLDTDKEINRINRLINDMLDVSRIRAGKLSLHVEKVNLKDVIHDVVAHFRLNPTFRDIEIKECMPYDISGFWDKNRIEQIAINLLSNALKYGERKPVFVSTEVENQNARLIVEDHGTGISPQDQKRIFQRFERAAASESISGLGLGLYIVKEIVNMHGGKIRVESELNKGSRFMVELPLKVEEKPSDQAA